MDKHELFDIWAPHSSIWSAWAKPVLFAHLPRTLPAMQLRLLPDLRWVPPASEGWAVVVDLPGGEAVWLGAALAERGYRPVPVFNACPPPEVNAPAPAGTLAVIDVDSTLAALVHYAGHLEEQGLPTNAPPAFLVDADRQRPLQPVRSGLFDNRSVLFWTDFPSAKILAAQHIERVLLVCEQSGRLDQDLAYVLRTWQRAGIALSRTHLTAPGPLQPFSIGGWWLLFNLWHRLTSALRFQHNPGGGYGWFVPEPTSG